MKNGMARFGKNAALLAVIGALPVAAPGCGLWKKESAKPTAAKSAPPPAAETAKTNLVIAPATGPIGKVASVNAQAKFAVLSFPIGQVPRKETKLTIYRAGTKAGEIKITGPEQDTLTVGDIITGTAEAGDEVRVD